RCCKMASASGRREITRPSRRSSALSKSSQNGPNVTRDSTPHPCHIYGALALEPAARSSRGAGGDRGAYVVRTPPARRAAERVAESLTIDTSACTVGFVESTERRLYT